MQRLDWSALIQPIQSPACTQEAACSHGKVVTGPLVDTHQAIDYKDETNQCNHVTTKNTEIEEVRPPRIEETEHLPGGEWCGNDRADSFMPSQPIARPSLHYRLRDAGGRGGSVIGEPGEGVGSLLADLLERYGERLDLKSVTETGRMNVASASIIGVDNEI